MKSFFKSLLASIIGSGIVLGALFVIFMIMMTMMLASTSFDSEEKYTLKKNSVLHLQLSGILSDRVEKNPLAELFGGGSDGKVALVDVLNAIDIAKYDDKIEGIYINAGAFSASSASLKEIRDALINFRLETDKFIIAYGDIYTQGCYYLASIADEVYLNPEGSLDIHGYSSSPMFYKDLLEKVGIEMQIFKVGTFKSAVEPYINTEMSEPNKEQVASYINNMWKTLAEGISDARNIPLEKLNEIADYAPALRGAQYVVDNNLVDSLLYETDVHKRIKDLMNLSYTTNVRLASPANVASTESSVPNKKSNLIAILYGEGSITSGSGRDGITDKRYVKELEKLKNNDKVKAVVFRVNSPGGSAFASEQIWKAVTDLKKEKPVVVSMGDVAASGGYYISANASKIYAQPNTITGSIGIFGMFPNIEGLTNKIGLSFDNVKTHKLADFGDITRPMREDEKMIVQNYVERGYDLFLKRCAEGRGVSIDSINAIGQGRVWTGNQALEIGLIDEIGGIDDAIEEAANLANIYSYETVSYPKQVDFFEALFQTKKDEFATQIVKDYLGVDYKAFEVMREIKQQDYLQARMPYSLNIE